MNFPVSTQDKLRKLEDEWLAAERAVLEHPEYPPCMLTCARKRLNRLEEAKWKAGPQRTLPLSTND